MTNTKNFSVGRRASQKPSGDGPFKAVVDLFVQGWTRREIWLFLAHQDIQSRFRRSRVGVIWMVLQQLAFAIGGGLLWSLIFGIDPAEFIPFIAAGFAIWGLVSAAFVDGNNTFVVSQGYLKQASIPLPVFVWRHVATALVPFAIGLSVAVVTLLGLGSASVLWGLPALLVGMTLLAVCLLFVVATMAFVGAMFGDAAHAMTGIFQMLFVVSPVIYPPSLMRARGLDWFVDINPLTAMLEIVRVPIVESGFAEPFYYFVVLAIAAVFVGLYAVLSSRIGRHIIYYL